MITLDQVHLLEHKVESAVAKIVELQRKNLLMSEKCIELEQVNASLLQKIASFEADQGRIEQGILHALDRLNSMENSLVKSGSAAPAPAVQEETPSAADENTQEEIILNTSSEENAEPAASLNNSTQQQENDFDLDFQIDVEDEPPSKPQNGQFDIF